jgi:FixJ family two-component response regulator
MIEALPAAGSAAARTLNVAIVDDDENDRRALSTLLRAAGMNVSSYASAEQFLEYAEQRFVDCLVLDIHLRGMSGFDLRRHLTDCGAAPPVIFITARDKPATREQARLAHCAAYFAKPFPLVSLIDAINRATEHRLIMDV